MAGDVTLSAAKRLGDYEFEMSSPTICYKNHRFPPSIIARAVWLYFRFPLSLRLVEEMLLERGIVVSYETIRRWARKFGTAYAKQLRRKRPSRRDIWHLDEVVISIGGRKHWLWRAVDQDGYVLDEIVQARRDTKAAKRLLVRLLKKQGLAPKRIITDKLRSYGAARRDVMPAVEHRSHKGLNDAGISFCRWFATLHLGLFSSSQSLRRTASETLSPGHPRSSDPCNGAVESRDRRNRLSSQINALSGR